MPDESYTTEDIARLLKISKLTVYDLIKKGELPAYRVGKQMRVDASDLEAYKSKAKKLALAASGAATSAPLNSSSSQDDSEALKSRGEDVGQPQSSTPAVKLPMNSELLPNGPTGRERLPQERETAARTVVITGQDHGLDLLASYLTRAGYRPLRSHKGSLDSLVDMYRGLSDLVSTHLWDGDTGEYNLPYIRRLLVGSPLRVVNLLQRNAGLYVAKGNPHRITGWDDLIRPGLRLVNRERGAGARVLLEEQMRLRGLSSRQLQGYEHCVNSHLEVAAAIASGEADYGVGMEKTAALVPEVEFIPLIVERYDLVILRTAENEQLLSELERILALPAFRRELGAITGCDVSQTGSVWLEI